MYPTTSYPIALDLFGRTRWQAEIDGQFSRFARRAYSQEAAERKIARDEEALRGRGHITFMQRWVLPAVVPLRRRHDRLLRTVNAKRRRVRRYK